MVDTLSNEYTTYLTAMARLCATWAAETTAVRKRARWTRRSSAYRCAAGIHSSASARRRVIQWLLDEAAEYRDLVIA